jgi:hypothetical protein
VAKQEISGDFPARIRKHIAVVVGNDLVCLRDDVGALEYDVQVAVAGFPSRVWKSRSMSATLLGFDRVYGVREATLVETCQRLTYNSDGPYQATGTPKSLDHKFITEDVPTGLIPMSALGAAAEVRTPAIDALVETVRNMTGKDFAAEARTLERLGLGGMGGPQIRRVMNEGFG